MNQQKLLGVAILMCVTVGVGSCRSRDTDQTKDADEVQRSLSPSPRGAPGNPRGPTDPSR
jgi:hypothetical protein